MDQAKTLESGGRRAEAVKGGDHDFPVGACDYVSNLSSAADQKADLTIDFSGKGSE
jgi:hypothetical protein